VIFPTLMNYAYYEWLWGQVLKYQSLLSTALAITLLMVV
jgi:hypothetical protein